MADERPQTWGSALGRGVAYLLLGFGLLLGGVALFSRDSGAGLVFTLIGVPSLLAGLILMALAQSAEAKARPREDPPR